MHVNVNTLSQTQISPLGTISVFHSFQTKPQSFGFCCQLRKAKNPSSSYVWMWILTHFWTI